MEVVIGLVLRQLTAVVSGWLLAKGYADGESASAIAGGIAAAGATSWSFWQKRRSGAL